MAGPRLLEAFAAAYPRATFVEIGANDGEQHDFLRPLVRKGGWRGVVVEPVPYVFERLQRTYRDRPGVVLANVAVAAADGPMTFHHLKEASDWERQGLPRWYDGIGSFSREEVLMHRPHIPDIDDRIVSVEVPCVTFESLCARHGIDRLDLILIDTEGYDWEIIRRIDLATWKPRLLVYEHYHLDQADREACRAHLSEAGYQLLEEHFDTFCLDAHPDDALTGLWQGLEPAVPGVAAYEEAV